MYDELITLMRRIDDENRVAMPWVEWAKRNPVKLRLSDYAPPGAAYVLFPPYVEQHTVTMAAATLRDIRRMLAPHMGTFPPTDQELAEMMAWQQASSIEPSETGDAVRR